MKHNDNLIPVNKAIKLAHKLSGKNITRSHILYLLQHGRLAKHSINGKVFIEGEELKSYYMNIHSKEKEWKKKLGKNLSWKLSFAKYREKETTKHVHRLHPYKGKFIPQLVEYFLNSKTDSLKKSSFFKPGDIVIDPFCGSGTTLIQANELGINCIGIDVSMFNSLISNVKIKQHDISQLENQLNILTSELDTINNSNNFFNFKEELDFMLSNFNKKHFPSPQFKRDVLTKKIDDKVYGNLKLKCFLKTYNKLKQKYQIDLSITKSHTGKFLDNWFLPPVKKEIEFLSSQIKKIEDQDIQDVAIILMSRTVRSCRSTTHSDLGTLKKAVTEPYYCKKHAKICIPITSIKQRWWRYSKDILKRIKEFNQLRTETNQYAISGDSRNIDILKELKGKNKQLYNNLKLKKADGIFTSPPYVGLIDYHEQHAYSYEIFNFKRNDKLEIGPLFKGQGQKAKECYVQSIAEVLINSKKFMKKDCDIFMVANDKYNLYPKIAKIANLKIVKKYNRPVLNRIEKDRSAYSEFIFHMKG